MKKGKSLYLIILLVLILIKKGCSKSTSTSDNLVSNNTFFLLSTEVIKDGSINGVNIKILVDKETKVMYMMTVKHSQGYGVGLEVMVDEDGKPLLYN